MGENEQNLLKYMADGLHSARAIIFVLIVDQEAFSSAGLEALDNTLELQPKGGVRMWRPVRRVDRLESISVRIREHITTVRGDEETEGKSSS